MYDVRWLIQGRVLEIVLSGDFELEELIEMNHAYHEYVRADGIAPVHVIVDAKELTNLKLKAKEIDNFFDSSLNPLFGWTTIVTQNHFMKFLLAIFSKFTGSQFKTVATYDEAIAVIQKHVPELTSKTT